TPVLVIVQMGRLDRLELENFKSYKGHQTIGPFHNFTSVIGPNGAGKSNLMDAISFVLGIKSAQLRSSQLRDLIYRDDNGNEIKFHRSITSTGTSEYRIDNKVVTYAKYNQALEQQNILVKARNFLVFQGDVEAIASQSPKDLTRLIEQINIQEYQRQKAQAQQFEKLQNEKMRILVDYLLWKLYHIQENINECRDQINSHEEVIKEKQQVQKKHEADHKQARMEQVEIHKKLYRLEKRNPIKRKRIGRKGSSSLRTNFRPLLLTVGEKITYSNRKLTQLDGNAERIRKDYDRQSKRVEDLQLELENVTTAADDYETSLNAESSSSKRNAILNADELAEYNRLREQANKQTVYEKQQLENLRRQEKTCRESTQRLKEKMEDLDRRRSQLEEEKSALTDHKEKVSANVMQLKSDIDNSKKELQAAVAERESISQQEIQLNRELQEILNQLTVASVDQRESEREQRMKECLESLKRVFSGVHGRLLDLFSPTQRKYAVPVSIILGRNLDAIIVDQQKIAIECIQYMREQRLGHATFIPLDTIVVKSINDKYRSIMKGARLAIDVITYNDKLERAFQYACGNTLVCDTLEIAKHICYEKNQQVKAVTLDGTIIHKSGLITGGHSDDILSGAKRVTEKRRADNIDALRAQRDDLMSKLNNLSKSKRRGNFEEQKKSEISGLESRLEFSQQDLAISTTKLAAINDELAVISNEATQLSPILEESQNELVALDTQVNQCENNINEKEDTVFREFCRRIGVSNIRDYEQRQLKMAQEIAEKRLKFTTQKSKLQNQLKFETEQKAETEDRLNRLESAISDETDRLSQLEDEKKQLLEEKRRISDEISEEQRVLSEIKNEYNVKTATVTSSKRLLAQISKEIDKLMKEIVNKESDIEKLEADRFSIFRKCKLEEIDLPLLRGSLDNVLAKDSVSYKIIDFDSLSEYLKENDGVEITKDFEKKLDEKTAKMEEIAPSLKSIERLDGIEQRLRDTEKEFDSARREAKTAKERFNAVKQKSRSFPLGGTAYLSLEDTEEPYLDGVKYHAMPPMKRFRDMEQLSGGEKTMAALALLFAIHSYQPSPFFVLDEVDAALDNTNVGKIANYIREHASDTFQFIVISLKSTLYEKAQALVGIYRDQEINSSKTLTLH
ncbi:4083_t:CDS:10, partial [Gigaspora margarita]